MKHQLDILRRIADANTTTRPDILMSLLEEAATEIAELRDMFYEMLMVGE